MSLLNRRRPKLRNSDPDVRAEAVRELEKEEVDLLTAVAQTDTDIRVRRIAVKKLESPLHLLEISEKDEDESLRAFARGSSFKSDAITVMSRNRSARWACSKRPAISRPLQTRPISTMSAPVHSKL